MFFYFYLFNVNIYCITLTFLTIIHLLYKLGIVYDLK